MQTFPIFINIPKTDFCCPWCQKKYTDEKEKYYKKICKAIVRGYAVLLCTCGKKFGIAADMTGDTVAFKLPTSSYRKKIK